MYQLKLAIILEDHVHLYMQIVLPQHNYIYQQDNAMHHTARSVCRWFEEHQDKFTELPGQQTPYS